jgi:hypothetical protein
MKYKNCGVIATKAIFIQDNILDMCGDDSIPPLTVIEGAIVDVPNMQKELFDP